ncbi:MAG: hypothetical protein ABT940_09675 [Alphaproteobacteria bacterium]
MDRTIKTVLWGVAVISILLILAIAWTKHMVRNNPLLFTMTGGESSSATQMVVFQMGEVGFSIPRNYFWRLPGHNGMAPDGMNFAIVALLPDFEPRTQKNANEFDKPGWNNNIFISPFFKGNMPTGKKLFDNIYRVDSLFTDRTVHYKYNFSQYRSFYGDVFFSGTLDDPGFFIECSPIKPAEHPVPSPSCGRYVLVGRDLYIHYSYSRTYLEHSQKIEQNLIAFFNRFRTSGPALEVIQ